VGISGAAAFRGPEKGIEIGDGAFVAGERAFDEVEAGCSPEGELAQFSPKHAVRPRGMDERLGESIVNQSRNRLRRFALPREARESAPRAGV
jgi:hypothetical protein